MKIHHHTKYKEIHGIDKIELMTMSEHVKLHQRLRKEGKCKVPTRELSQISRKARNRSKAQTDYDKKTKQTIYFYERLGKNVELRERIMYNKHTGTVSYWVSFLGNNGYILPIMEALKA